MKPQHFHSPAAHPAPGSEGVERHRIIEADLRAIGEYLRLAKAA